jgi:hypothetical protein
LRRVGVRVDDDGGAMNRFRRERFGFGHSGGWTG